MYELKTTPGPWKWWTSCSFRRLSSEATGRDGDVLCAVTQRSDGHPDVHLMNGGYDGPDGRAIAAVPDMLKVLQMIDAHYRHHQILAMRAAVVDGHLRSPEHGLQWIVNTLEGPGHLPNLDEARALGGAQAMFDKEVAEQEAFRTAHPAPGA